MKKIATRIILIVCLLLLIGGIAFYKYSNRDRYNDGYVNGNTAGNLYNTGLFCEHDGVVYFANPNDDNALYSMNVDGTDLKKLSSDSVAYINADDNYVYYVRTSNGVNTTFAFLHVNTNSLCRIRKDGKGSIEILDEAPSIYASLVGNYIYYLHYDKEEATTLYRVKIDGEELGQVFRETYFTCNAVGQYLYFNGLTEDHNIYQYDTVSGQLSMIYEGNCWMPTVVGNTVYFMDCENNYKLASVDLTTQEKTILCDDRIDCYNVVGDYIYFQRNSDDPAICRMRTDGSDYELVKPGIFTDINATSKYVYFKDYSSEMVYYTAIGSDAVNVFNP